MHECACKDDKALALNSMTIYNIMQPRSSRSVNYRRNNSSACHFNFITGDELK